ncbi:MAG: DNA primase [Alphaproteobacteria bacterium]|nr:DNA primase [Alphaproteobacteria bacterium]
MQFDRNFVDELKARVKLSDVVGRKLRLIRRGREFVGLSPFSNEKSPSFTINDDKGFYHCFSSGKHGDAITFLMETESLSFQEAVEKLAGDLGMEIPRASFQNSEEQRQRQARRVTLYTVMQQAAAFFAAQLDGPSGAGARAYLDRRQTPQDIRKAMGLGYALPLRTALCDALIKSGVTPDQLVESGLAIKPDTGGLVYDRFRDRIIFPITDNSDRVIAFGGRAMSADAQAKYLNSPETPLFHKGDVLYNLASARRALQVPVKGNGRDSLIVAEGYMDVIALTRAGIPNAVAPLGTALTEAQMALLWRLTPEPILCFDGDGAGTRAMLRAVERALPLLAPGRSLRFVLLPDGLDPDDIISRQGAAAMEALLKTPLPLADILWSAETSRMPLDTPERRAGLEQRLNALVATIADPAVRKYYQNDMRQRIGALFRAASGPSIPQQPYNTPQRRYPGRGRQFPPPVGVGPASTELKRTHLVSGGANVYAGARRERLLLSIVLNHPVLLDGHIEVFSGLTLRVPKLDKLRSEIIELTALLCDLEKESLRSHLIDRGHGELLDELARAGEQSGDRFSGGGADHSNAEAIWIDTVRRHRAETDEAQEIEEAKQTLAESFSDENARKLIILKQQSAKDAEDEQIGGLGGVPGWSLKP